VKVSADGSLAEGTMVRGGAQELSRIKTTFTGTFARAWNPFVERHVSTLRTGRYEDSKGRIYDGDFQYIPTRVAAMGVYIFQGVRIDPEEDEVQPGLFVSDPAGHTMNITFYRARPDYLAKLQRDYLGEKEDNDRDARTQAFFKSLLGLTNAGINMLQGARANPGGLSNRRMAFDLLSQVIQGQQKPEDALDTMGSDMQRRIAAQPKLNEQLQLAGVTTSREVAQKVAASLLAQPRKMTQKDYAELLRQAQQP
jgi:hypothetical protein